MSRKTRRRTHRPAPAKPATPPQAEQTAFRDSTAQPINPMLRFILACITPILAIAGLTPDQATQAAIQALDAQPGSVLQAGQAVAFTLASLDSLRLSAAADLSPSLRLKFRGNANSLNRSAARHATLQPQPQSEPPPPPTHTPPELKTLIRQAEALHADAAPAADPRREADLRWAGNLITLASDHLHELPTLPQTEKIEHTSRILAMCSAAREIITGEKSYPGA